MQGIQGYYRQGKLVGFVFDFPEESVWAKGRDCDISINVLWEELE